MSTLIIDLGCSNLKFILYKGGDFDHFLQVPTPQTVEDILHAISQRLQDGYYYIDEGEFRRATPVSTIMIISFSDAVFYDTDDGMFHQLLPLDDIRQHPELPSYQETGNPTNSQLPGIGNQLLHIRDTVGLKNIRKILPPSLFIAAHLTGNTEWKRWDITHASNSGMWDYTRGKWHQAMETFFEAGIIDEEVVKPSEVLWHARETGYPEIKFLCGGHDTVFANALDIPYSTKPYISCGTWVTASAESEFRKLDPRHSSRFVIAPNGTTLHQLCFKSNAKDLRYAIKFLEKKQLSAPVRVFGGWAEEASPHLKSKTLDFQLVEGGNVSYLHSQAMKYAEARVIGR